MSKPKTRTRFPKFVPQWLQRRMEVNTYILYAYMQAAGESTPPEALVLDAGAGEGRFKPEFAHTRYIGVDLAVGDVSWDYSDLDAICNLFDIPFPDNTFDMVLCNQVLEHVPEPSDLLAELTRLLKPGGQVIISAPQSWHQHQKPHDFYRYTSFGMRYLVEKAGLEVKELIPLGGYFWFLSFQLQNLNYWLFPKGTRGRQWTWPIRLVNAAVFQVFFPLILFYLDPLDRIKDETFGYLCLAEKPAVAIEN